jgi:hypothetical protein
LGGHISKAHPGSSEIYNRKQQIRKERALERKLLSMAKKRFYDQYGKGTPLNRSKIRKYKN